MPHVYIVNGKPGTGKTDFEIIATFVFALVYLAPQAGVVYAQYEGSKSAKKASLISPMIYHFASTYGIFFVFG